MMCFNLCFAVLSFFEGFGWVPLLKLCFLMLISENIFVFMTIFLNAVFFRFVTGRWFFWRVLRVLKTSTVIR